MALHRAAHLGYLDIVQCFIKHLSAGGIEERTTSGKTALHFATWKGHYEVVKVLLEAGANVTALENVGHPLLFSLLCQFILIFFNCFVFLY